MICQYQSLAVCCSFSFSLMAGCLKNVISDAKASKNGQNVLLPGEKRHVSLEEEVSLLGDPPSLWRPITRFYKPPSADPTPPSADPIDPQRILKSDISIPFLMDFWWIWYQHTLFWRLFDISLSGSGAIAWLGGPGGVKMVVGTSQTDLFGSLFW